MCTNSMTYTTKSQSNEKCLLIGEFFKLNTTNIKGVGYQLIDKNVMYKPSISHEILFAYKRGKSPYTIAWTFENNSQKIIHEIHFTSGRIIVNNSDIASDEYQLILYMMDGSIVKWHTDPIMASQYEEERIKAKKKKYVEYRELMTLYKNSTIYIDSMYQKNMPSIWRYNLWIALLNKIQNKKIDMITYFQEFVILSNTIIRDYKSYIDKLDEDLIDYNEWNIEMLEKGEKDFFVFEIEEIQTKIENIKNEKEKLIDITSNLRSYLMINEYSFEIMIEDIYKKPEEFLKFHDEIKPDI